MPQYIFTVQARDQISLLRPQSLSRAEEGFLLKRISGARTKIGVIRGGRSSLGRLQLSVMPSTTSAGGIRVIRFIERIRGELKKYWTIRLAC
jgi:hypothetical protein